MLLLTATTQLIDFITSTTQSVDFTASFTDITTTTFVPGSNDGNVVTATTTTIVAAPAASTQRQIKYLSWRNAGASTNNITVRKTISGTGRTVFAVLLGAGETIQYTDGNGFRVFDSLGQEKTTGNIGAGRLIRAPQVITSGVTYAPPAGCTAIIVECQGGGGGGGGTTGGTAVNSAFGAGGAAGAHARRYYTNPPASCTIAIGAAGTAGAATGATGGVGGNTTFSDAVTTLTANGGPGGVGQVLNTTVAGALGGAAATTTNSDAAYTSMPGFSSFRQSGVLGFPGQGASSQFGGGGIAPVAAGAGATGTGLGSGGSGGNSINGAAAVTGGTGTAGLIRIWEYT